MSAPLFFRPSGAPSARNRYPRLTPWAVLLRPSGAFLPYRLKASTTNQFTVAPAAMNRPTRTWPVDVVRNPIAVRERQQVAGLRVAAEESLGLGQKDVGLMKSRH